MRLYPPPPARVCSARAGPAALLHPRANQLRRPDLKRELLAEQVRDEITELNSPTALRRFGAPFKSDFGEISPLDSDLPVLRYIFVHHIRDFPFLDKAKEKEFWQDKLQVVRIPRAGQVPGCSRSLYFVADMGPTTRSF